MLERLGPLLDTEMSMKFELIGKPDGCKLLRMTIEVEGPLSPSTRIRSISIRGDFFAIPEEAFDEIEAALAGSELQELGTRFDELVRQRGLECAGITGRGLDEIVQKELFHGV
jgi:hypothetical protein